MRAGVLISAVSHIVLVALALLGTPTLFEEAATRSIETEIVRAEDAPPAPVLDTTPIKLPDMPPEPETPIPYPAITPKPAQPPPAQAKSQPPPQQQAAKQASPEAAAPAPNRAPAPPPAPSPPSVFDPANIPTLLDMANAPVTGFDAAATTVANLSAGEKEAFKARLRKCWKLPDGLSPAQTTRVVLRVYLQRDGTLASDPILVEASASRDGPALVQTATRALKDCAPYGFLPAERYSEWKILDLSFSPRDMAGG
jgi:hypothetical protein